jgi:hypothetical protein
VRRREYYILNKLTNYGQVINLANIACFTCKPILHSSLMSSLHPQKQSFVAVKAVDFVQYKLQSARLWKVKKGQDLVARLTSPLDVHSVRLFT